MLLFFMDYERSINPMLKKQLSWVCFPPFLSSFDEACKYFTQGKNVSCTPAAVCTVLELEFEGEQAHTWVLPVQTPRLSGRQTLAICLYRPNSSSGGQRTTFAL